MKKRICRACNEGEVLPLAVEGRRTRYRSVPDLEIPADVVIPTCNRCGTEFLDASTTEQLDAGLREAFQRLLAEKMDAALETLKPHAPQRELERLLGLSGGYLSKLKGGKETSATLVAALLLLAGDPASRIDELRHAWKSGSSDGNESMEQLDCLSVSGRAMPSNKVEFRLKPPTIKGAA